MTFKDSGGPPGSLFDPQSTRNSDRVGWRGATVVVTGGSRGIGRAVARAAAARGARLGLIARTPAELDAARDEVLAAGAPAAATAAADVGDRHQLGAAIAALEAALGPVDILVANAGIGTYGPFVDVDPAAVDRVVAVNLGGTLHAVRAVVEGMIARRRGHIVVVGSIAGRIGSAFEATYSATKFAQVGFAEALAVELAPHGVGVSLVNPGPVDTGFFEARGHEFAHRFPRKVAPERVADAVIAAVEHRRPEQFVARWLGAAVVARHLVPPLLRWGTRRTFAAELAAERRRRGAREDAQGVPGGGVEP